MKRKKQVILLFLGIIIVGLGGFWYLTYSSLKNPFDEMGYSESKSINILNITSLSDVIGDDSVFDSSEQIFPVFDYSRDNLEEGETMKVFIGGTEDRTVEFLYLVNILDDDIYLGINYTYSSKNSTLTEECYLSDQTYDTEKTYKGEELLTQLIIYGKDVTWLKEVSQDVLEKKILGLWFEKGSSRYSLDNLGNLTIEYDKILE